jgi:hypothetical protein
MKNGTNMPNEILPILKEIAQVPGLLKQIYGDLAKPGVTQVGKALGSILGLGNTLLWPLALLNERSKIALEKNLEKYREQLSVASPDKIIEVPPEIGVPIAEKLTYVTDDQLSDLYVNLLAKASVFESAHTAHPSFVNVINNLSPDEALLLQRIRGDIPFLEARIIKGIKNGVKEWITLGQLLTGLETKTKLSFPQNIVAYMSNFEGLGLVEIRHDYFMVGPEGQYEELEKIYRPELYKIANLMKIGTLKFERGRINLTPYGSLFIAACFSKQKQPA